MLQLERVKDDLAEVTGVPVEIGPDLPEYPGAFVVLTSTGGPGLQTDGYTDAVSFQARVVGDQNDYAGAETLAGLVDTWLLSEFSYSRDGFNRWVVGVSRAGGAPSVLLRDEAERHHFVTSYLIEVDSTL